MRSLSLISFAFFTSLVVLAEEVKDVMPAAPSGPQIFAEVQQAVRAGDTAGCRIDTGEKKAEEIESLLLSATPSDIRTFKYFKSDGIVEIEFTPQHIQPQIFLWVVTKAGHCNLYNYWQSVE